jgi:uncharacterized membrane protein
MHGGAQDRISGCLECLRSVDGFTLAHVGIDMTATPARRLPVVTRQRTTCGDARPMPNPPTSALSRFRAPHALGGWRIAALCVVFVWFLLGGIAHFAFTEVEMRIVPPYIPWPRAAVLVSGVFELLGALGLLWHRTRRGAGFGLFLLTLAVTPCHIYMLQRPELFDVPYWALILRLPVQVALLALILWSTTPVRERGDGPRTPGAPAP